MSKRKAVTDEQRALIQRSDSNKLQELLATEPLAPHLQEAIEAELMAREYGQGGSPTQDVPREPAPPPPPAPMVYRTTTAGFIHRDGFIVTVAVGTAVAAEDRARFEAMGFQLEPAMLVRREQQFGPSLVEALAAAEAPEEAEAPEALEEAP